MSGLRQNEQGGYLDGALLVATPGLTGSCFEKAVVLVCSHSREGAMGMIVNRPLPQISSQDIFSQLDVAVRTDGVQIPVHFGGPVEPARGFVLHSVEYQDKETVMISEDVALTTSLTILQDIARGAGPEQSMLMLGYAGWAPGQLESEIEQNSWLTVPATEQLVFGMENSLKWALAGALQGIDMARVAPHAGHA